MIRWLLMMRMEEDLYIGQKVSTEFQEELINRKRKPTGQLGGRGNCQGLLNKTSKGSHPHQEMPGANTEKQDRIAPTGAVPGPKPDIQRLKMGIGVANGIVSFWVWQYV